MTDKAPSVTVEASMTQAQDLTEFRILLARFETKLDLVLTQHENELKDHETRLRVIEERKVVTPTALLASSATVVAICGGIVTLLDRLYA